MMRAIATVHNFHVFVNSIILSSRSITRRSNSLDLRQRKITTTQLILLAMAPIIVARSASADSTESSFIPKSLIEQDSSLDVKERSQVDAVEEEETENACEEMRDDAELINDGSVVTPATCKMQQQMSNLFVGEDELRDNRNNGNSSPSALGIDTSMHNTQSLTTRTKGQRFGLFSPSGSGELEEVSLSKSPLSNETLSTHFGMTNSLQQINTDAELARSLQAEEDKKQRRKPRPRGSTLECWFEDSMNQLGRRLSETASEFFGTQ